MQSQKYLNVKVCMNHTGRCAFTGALVGIIVGAVDGIGVGTGVGKLFLILDLCVC